VHNLWIGDFNRHHPHWDDLGNTRLFTKEALKAADMLIKVVAEAGLIMALLGGTPTHYHNVTKRWSRLNQVFLSKHSENLLIACDAQTEHRGINMDHLAILTELKLEASTNIEKLTLNFHKVDWAEFGKLLEKQLTNLHPVEQIVSQRQLDLCCDKLTKVIQNTIKEQVPNMELTTKLKHWWTKELTLLWKEANKLGRQSYKKRSELEHTIHQ